MLKLALSLFVSLGVVHGRVLTAELEYCTPKCTSICEQCVQSPPRKVVGCMDNTLLDGCSSRVLLTEAWNITHYCVATDSTLGGWGFLTPVVRDITPDLITSVLLEADLVPTTGPFDVLQELQVPVALTVETDTATSMQESVIHTCAIERYNGVSAVLQSTPIDTTRACPNGSTPDASLGCEFQPHHVSLNVTTPLIGSSPIPKSEVLFAILADSKVISNSGILPPALETALFTVTHKVLSGSETGAEL